MDSASTPQLFLHQARDILDTHRDTFVPLSGWHNFAAVNFSVFNAVLLLNARFCRSENCKDLCT
eukprot:scaffold2858_cov256-Chaetoceros_neogracile.AAC.6